MATGDWADVTSRIQAIFQANLGRNASADEINAQHKYLAEHPNEGQDFVLGNLNTQLAGSGEAQAFRGAQAQKGATAQAQTDYTSRAPMRAQMYSDLQDQAMQILGRGQSALRQNLAQRGLQDSGGMGKGMTELGLGANRMVAQGANAINLEDLNGAHRAGESYLDWQRNLENMRVKNDYDRGNMAYGAQLEEQYRPKKSWWDYLIEGANAGANVYSASKSGGNKTS